MLLCFFLLGATNVQAAQKDPSATVQKKKRAQKRRKTRRRRKAKKAAAELKEKEAAELKEKEAAELKEKEAAELKEKEAAELKEKEAAELKEKEAAELKEKVQPCEVVVMNLKPVGLPTEEIHFVEIITATLAAEIAASTRCRVITEADISSMIDFEATKAECGEGSESCLAEIGNALGVDLVVAGAIGKLGQQFSFQSSLRDVSIGRVKTRYNETFPAEPARLNAAAQKAARALFAGSEHQILSAGIPAENTPITETEAHQMSLWPFVSGGSIAAVGLLTVAIGGTFAVFAEDALGKPASPEDHDNIRTVGQIALAATATGVVITLGGTALAAYGLIE